MPQDLYCEERTGVKNYTPARRRLRELGWYRRDRATGANVSFEGWYPPADYDPTHRRGYPPFSFKSACRRAGVVITEEDEK